jgi:hypothetical protein
MTMRAKLRVDGGAIGDDEAQFYLVFSTLCSKVQGLVLPFVRRAQDQQEWKPVVLLDYLERTYDDPNKQGKQDNDCFKQSKDQ